MAATFGLLGNLVRYRVIDDNETVKEELARRGLEMPTRPGKQMGSLLRDGWDIFAYYYGWPKAADNGYLWYAVSPGAVEVRELLWRILISNVDHRRLDNAKY